MNTLKLSNGISILAKPDGTPLKYGNRTMAQTKASALCGDGICADDTYYVYQIAPPNAGLVSYGSESIPLPAGFYVAAVSDEKAEEDPEALLKVERNPAYDGPVGIFTDYDDRTDYKSPFFDSESVRGWDLAAAGSSDQSASVTMEKRGDEYHVIEPQDIHRETASEIFNIPLESVTVEQRREAKKVSYSTLYSSDPQAFKSAVRQALRQAAKQEQPDKNWEETRRLLQTTGRVFRGPAVSKKLPFATVSGPRINPRNRHNHHV